MRPVPRGLVIGAIVTLAGVIAARAETGIASYYGSMHEDGRERPLVHEGGRERPFDGQVACPGRRLGPMTAAHKSLPCGTRVRVSTSRGSAVLTITDRGPYVRGRIIDVSPDAARVLGLIGPGVLPATVEVQ